VRLASRGLRDLGQGLERIQDADELATVRAQARRVLFRSFLVTGLVMIGLLLLA
jgi:hypothetical protein